MNPNKEFLKNKANALPEKPGVYLMKDQHNEVLYVGKAKSLKQRVVSYFRKNQQHANKVLRLVYNVVDFETIETDTELDPSFSSYLQPTNEPFSQLLLC